MSDAAPPASTADSLRGIRQASGLSRHAVAKLIELGFVDPAREPGGGWRFTFQDLVLLRSAHDLRAAGIPTRQILRSLRRLKGSLPAQAPVSGLRITAVGDRIAVRVEGSQWEPDTGQLVMDFSVAPGAGSVSRLSKPAPKQGGGSGTPITWTSRMSSWVCRNSSISRGDTFSPPRMIMSFSRPVMLT